MIGNDLDMAGCLHWEGNSFFSIFFLFSHDLINNEWYLSIMEKSVAECLPDELCSKLCESKTSRKKFQFLGTWDVLPCCWFFPGNVISTAFKFRFRENEHFYFAMKLLSFNQDQKDEECLVNNTFLRFNQKQLTFFILPTVW